MALNYRVTKIISGLPGENDNEIGVQADVVHLTTGAPSTFYVSIPKVDFTDDESVKIALDAESGDEINWAL